MFLNDVSLCLCRSQRCCYPSCLLPSFPVHRSRLPAHESIALNGAVWRSKASNLIPGAIVPNHTVRPLVPCFCAFNRVSLWTLPPVVVVSLWCGVAPGRVAPGSRCGVVGHCLQWAGWIVGVSPLLEGVYGGAPPMVGAAL